MFIKLRVRNIRNNTQTKKEYQRAISEYQSTVSNGKESLYSTYLEKIGEETVSL